MDKNYLIINIGSTSKRYALFRDTQEIFSAHFEKEQINFMLHDQHQKQPIQAKDYTYSLLYITQLLTQHAIIKTASDVTALGIRIVAADIYCTQNRLLDQKYQQLLEKVKERTLLHTQETLWEIEQAHTLFSHVPIIALSDSNFHTTMPPCAQRYALTSKITDSLGIYRFGYHGISLQSIIRHLRKSFKPLPEKIIVCHLGGGSSVTALKDGKSIDTSMGFTPLEGVPMETRIGNIDAGALIYLGQQLNFSFSELSIYLTTECGMLGLSGLTANFHDLIVLGQKGDEHARTALELYAYSVKKYIGSYYAVLGGLDLLVFTGGIGENEPVIRLQICKELSACGIVLDEHKNAEHQMFIESAIASTQIAVMKTQEMLEMAYQLKSFLDGELSAKAL